MPELDLTRQRELVTLLTDVLTVYKAELTRREDAAASRSRWAAMKLLAAQRWDSMRLVLRDGPLRFCEIMKRTGLTNNQVCSLLRQYRNKLSKSQGMWALSEGGQRDG